MTDRLTPPQLRDLATLITLTGPRLSDLHHCLIEEAARREAEAKPRGVSIAEKRHANRMLGGCDACMTPTGCWTEKHCDRDNREWPDTPQGEREGPGSAAAPDDWLAKSIVASVVKDKPTPAADDFAHSLRSVTTVDHRWDAHALSIARDFPHLAEPLSVAPEDEALITDLVLDHYSEEKQETLRRRFAELREREDALVRETLELKMQANDEKSGRLVAESALAACRDKTIEECAVVLKAKQKMLIDVGVDSPVANAFQSAIGVLRALKSKENGNG